MRKLFFFATIFFISSAVFAQEICDNAIDDDGDGLIDLNDDECDCDGFGEEIESLIPNPSFEDMDCCPDAPSQLDCATTWIQASTATSDYYNLCDFDDPSLYGPVTPPDWDLPGGGAGWVGYLSNTGWEEYIGACLDGTLLGGVSYTLNFYAAYGAGGLDHEFTIFGTPDCADLPWAGTSCPDGIDGWQFLASEVLTYPADGSWMEVTITFTPPVDINAIAFGGPCGGEGDFEYYYADELTLIDSESFSDITEIGSLCDEDLVLEATADSVGGTWQWYLDGVALVGETSSTLDAWGYGLGFYSAVYTIGDNCLRSDHIVNDLEAVTANFEFTSACLGEEIDFTNTSVYGGGVSPTWDWDFGDAGSSTDESPSHLYTDPGTYTVELIAINDAGCNDTIEIEVTVDPVPVADFEFVIGGFSSEDGATGGCIASAVQFNDLSTIADPGVITSWSWDFGDGSTSDEENPEHTYGAPGTYTVTLTVETENGCSSTYELDIIMTESLTLDIISNDPTCFGFSDGSITVNVTGGSGDLVFEIKNDLGDLMNEDNSNTANTLPTGTYTITVSDDTECSGEATVFLDQPDEMNADLTVVDPLCYGDATGWVRVDSVYNATGLYDQISFFWAPNPPNHEGLGADSLWDLYAGDYTLTINDENGCSKVFDFVVDEPDSLHFVEFGFEDAYCRMFGYQSGNGVVFGAAAGGTPDYTYLWENLDNGDTEITSTWGGLNPGDYRLTATDENGCVISRELFLDSLNPEAIFTVISDQLNDDCQGTAPVEVEFENNSINFYNENDPFGDSTFFWNLNSPNGDWQLTHDYLYRPDTIYLEKSQTYEVEVCLVALNKNGCSDTACKIITVYKPIAFEDINIFTPNGDGNNDVFTFEFRSASISEFHCVIVNRWGVVVEELNDIAEGWDGTDKNGDPCKDGVYFYVYEAITDNNNTLTGQGNIQLVTGN